MKLFLPAIATFLLTPTFAQQLLPKETSEALEKMQQFLKDEERHHADRKNKILIYYITALKEQKEKASLAKNEVAVNAINKELIKLVSMQGDLISDLTNPSSPKSPSISKIPEITEETKFKDLEEIFDANKQQVEIITVTPKNQTEALDVKGSCILAPFIEDEWTLLKGKMDPVNFRGHNAKRQGEGNSIASLCYSVNNGPWIEVKEVMQVEVKGEIKFCCFTKRENLPKDKASGSIRLRVLTLK
jgi:hypothetical protein